MSRRTDPSYEDLLRALDQLPLVLRGVRQARGLSLRQAAGQMGVSFSTVSRLEHGTGGTTALSSVIAAMRWIRGDQ